MEYRFRAMLALENAMLCADHRHYDASDLLCALSNRYSAVADGAAAARDAQMEANPS